MGQQAGIQRVPPISTDNGATVIDVVEDEMPVGDRISARIPARKSLRCDAEDRRTRSARTTRINLIRPPTNPGPSPRPACRSPPATTGSPLTEPRCSPEFERDQTPRTDRPATASPHCRHSQAQTLDTRTDEHQDRDSHSAAPTRYEEQMPPATLAPRDPVTNQPRRHPARSHDPNCPCCRSNDCSSARTRCPPTQRQSTCSTHSTSPDLESERSYPGQARWGR